MRKDKVKFNIRMNKDEGFVVKNVRGYLVELPFGYTGVVHRPEGYVKGGKKYWCVSEFFTGCLIHAGFNEAPRENAIGETIFMICEMGLARFETGVREVLSFDEVN